MTRVHKILYISLLLCGLLNTACAQSNDDNVDSFIRFFSPNLRHLESRLSAIDKEISTLPPLRDQPWGSRYGHQSDKLPNETTADWLQMDMGWMRLVDMIALMPVYLSYRGVDGAGYGFPKRFRIEISEHADMSSSKVLVDCSKEDVPNPGRHPLVFEFAPVKGRYLRITSVKHDFRDESYFWALEELIVLEGNKLAATKANLSMSSGLDLYPQWVPVRISDGQSTLGMPVDVNSPSTTLGYLSAKSNKNTAEDPSPSVSQKWCAVDLGAAEEIEQVLLLPLESDAYEVLGGRGFPRQFVVQLANDKDFQQIIWQSDLQSSPLGYPDGCSMNLLVPKQYARYVRVLVEKMWSRDDWFVFGLAELQVYGSENNLALGKQVYAKDATSKTSVDDWALNYLVDGFTSRYRLIEWPDYLRLMDKRGRLEREKATLELDRSAKLDLGRKTLSSITILVAILVLTSWLWGMMRHRVLRRREAEQLRQQIARDLHDDIGSNLGGIVLLSEIGSEHSADEESRSDFAAIRKAAEDASLALRDIVWLIQRDQVGLKDFVTRMRQSLHVILNYPEVSFTVEPAVYRDRNLGLLFRRHVFLAFKEVLNNVRKHALTRQASVQVWIESDRLRFTVSDQGIGFNPTTSSATGHGMSNLKRRAARVSGSIHIDSAPAKGTKVTFEAPFSP